MKIGITGAQGTGKTTLASALAKVLSLPLIQEQARIAARDLGIKKLGDLGGDPQKGVEYQWACLDYQRLAEATYLHGFVSDRTTIDNAAYWLKWHSHNAPSKENMRYYEMALDHAMDYDLLIYVPAEFGPAKDGFRSTDVAYQREVDLYIRMIAGMVAVPTITVKGSLEDRVNQAVAEISSANKGRE